MVPPIILASSGAGNEVMNFFLMSVLSIGVLFVAIVWIIFPFLVNAKFNELLRVQRAANELLKKIADGTAGSRGAEAPPTLEAKREAATPPPVPAGVYKLD